MEDKKELTTNEEIKVFTDPYRLKILDCLYKNDTPKNVKEVADHLGEVPAKVYYHVKKMESADIIRLVYTREINGIIAKYYEPTAKNFEIKGNENIKKSVKGQVANLISSLYDESKTAMLMQIEGSTLEKFPGSINFSSVYLTEDELKEFQQFIKDFLVKYEKEDKNNSEKVEYHLFTSMYKIVNDKYKFLDKPYEKK